MEFKVHRYERVDSTNRLAATGGPGEVFVASEQSAGRGRLDHRWHSAAGENLLMSVVLDVTGLAPTEVATFPLVAGLAVAEAVAALAGDAALPPLAIKWPNDVYLGTRKLAGILCERHGDRIVVGIGLNVCQRDFPVEIRERATSLAREGVGVSVDLVLDAVLASLSGLYAEWHRGGFAAVHPRFEELDFLKGREVSVFRTDDDAAPLCGLCRGISADGSLLVGTVSVFAGEVRWG